MVECAFAIPGDIGLPTGGYAYDRRLLALMPADGVELVHLPLPGSFPFPTEQDLDLTGSRLFAVPPTRVLLIDGLAYGALPERLISSIRAPIVALVHHPLGLEAGLGEPEHERLIDSERGALALARHIVVTSAATARLLVQDFAVTSERITVAVPGVEPAPRARGSGAPSVHILAVGAVVPRKGYDLLVEALAGLKPLAWHLTIAGALDRSPKTARTLEAQIARLGLEERLTLAGAVDDAALAQLYDGADLFVMSSHFEGYGMVLAEALARGLPIVTTTGGAAGETVPDAAAIKVMPGSARALMWVLGRALDEPRLRSAMADAAWSAASALPRWEATSAIVADVIRRVAR